MDCNLTDSFFITSPNPLQVSYNIDSVSCSGYNDGAINTTINGISNLQLFYGMLMINPLNFLFGTHFQIL